MSQDELLMDKWQRARLADQDGFLAGINHVNPKCPWWNLERVGAMMDVWARMSRNEQDDFLKGVIL